MNRSIFTRSDTGQPFEIRRMNLASGVIKAGALLIAGLLTTAVLADPPARVARLAVTDGSVSYSPSGQTTWVQAGINQPIQTGDRLYTTDNGLAEIEFGGASLRIDRQTVLNLLNLNDQQAQAEIDNGNVNLNVSNIQQGQTYEVDTPVVAFVANSVGEFRVDISPVDHSTTVMVYSGGGVVYGANGASYVVSGHQSYQFFDSQLTRVIGGALPPDDDFDHWVQSRDQAESQAADPGYVSPQIVGSADLGNYGDWQHSDDGPVWYPNDVPVDWAPYSNGYWSYVQPWGWTWIDYAPWGYAPFHYGRWAYYGNRWGWVPGPVSQPPIWAPALVTFTSGPGGSVSWFPLGPREVYCPPYAVSATYFYHVNVASAARIDTRQLNQIYASGVYNRPPTINYVNRNVAYATTTVSHAAFVGARPIGPERIRAPGGAPVSTAVAPQEVPRGEPAMLSGRARGVAPPATREIQPVRAPRGELPATMPPTVYNQPLSRTMTTSGNAARQAGNLDLARQAYPSNLGGEGAPFPQAPTEDRQPARTYPYRDAQNSGAGPNDQQLQSQRVQEQAQQQAAQQRQIQQQQQATQQRQMQQQQEQTQQRQMQQQQEAQQREMQQRQVQQQQQEAQQRQMQQQQQATQQREMQQQRQPMPQQREQPQPRPAQGGGGHPQPEHGGGEHQPPHRH